MMMSLKLEDRHAFNRSDPADRDPSSSCSNNRQQQQQEGDIDILDELLDSRAYEPQSSMGSPLFAAQPSNIEDLGLKEDEIFNTFLTEDLNRNEFIMFNNAAVNEEQAGLSISNFQAPDESSQNPYQSGLGVQDDRFIRSTTPMSSDAHNSPSSMSKPEIFTTPNSTMIEGFNGVSGTDGRPSTIAVPAFDASYEAARKMLSQLKFGKTTATQFDEEIPKEYFEVDQASLPYKLDVKNLPSYSRVETQIKVEMSISPPPPQFLVHLPADTIAKQKLCLSTDIPDAVKDNMLFLDTFVLKGDNKSCNICERCIRREQKRASRRKSGVSDNLNWGTNTKKRAIIFNCKEVISFPPSIQNSSSKGLEVSARIVCYCRHHQEPKGFRLMFILKDSRNKILAKHVSTGIMIMDRKKNADEKTSTTNGGNTAAENSDEVPSMRLSTAPISPTSIEDDSSEPHTTDSRVFKRKRTWSLELSDGFNIAPSRNTSVSTSLAPLKKEPISPLSSNIEQSVSSAPTIQRVIPSQGPLRGGIEVTLLGSNFRSGLIVKFGVNKALSTHCWSDTTMVTYLPPAVQPGQVLVSFEDSDVTDKPQSLNTAIFTYLDDSDRQMIELALQIVGLKMNGKLEDARNVARKIIGSDKETGGSLQQSSGNDVEMTTNRSSKFNDLSNCSDEDLVLNVIHLLPSNPNWGICTQEGQTLLHLSCLKGYYKLVSSLIKKGARVDCRDINGYTPLHFASLAGDRNSIELLINCKASTSARANNGVTPEDVADANVLDIFKFFNSPVSRKLSSSSISSSIFSVDDLNVDIQTGAHISRMTHDHLTDLSGDTDSFELDLIDASDEESADDELYQGYADDEDDQDDGSVGSPLESPVVDREPSTNPVEVSLWNKVRNVFNNTSENEELPKYDDLFPSRSAPFTVPKLVTVQQEDQDGSHTNSSDESEDVFMKFFNQRKNVQNDKMLFFFWMPLLILMVSIFILSRSGWTFDWNDKFQEFVRSGFGTVMLGNERVKVAFNKRFSQVNQSVTSAINAA